ncbi:MAG: hypothetical protein KDA44_05935 [Planctomycetales bacterium]|nr:hypothetical protein [Planctomycetales bacterium]
MVAALVALAAPAVARPDAARSRQAIDQLRARLAAEPDRLGATASDSWRDVPLTRADAAIAQKLLRERQVALIRQQRAAEWQEKRIEIGQQALKFETRPFGQAPEGRRSLFISMHGGGGAPAAVNDQQWRNQVVLYQPDEGLYVAPRAPTDEWNLWHQAHIDALFDRLISDAVVFAGVDPNRVYLMGYSAGGDGVYQLAPRMADRWAAASMMAGHPNDASPLNLRNIGFAIHVGALDGAYQRNEVAHQWGEKLDELQQADPQGYVHHVEVHPGRGHWMNREDASAVPWMAQFTRNPLPERIVWRQDDVPQSRLYWLEVEPEQRKPGAMLVASRRGQTIEIERAENVTQATVLLCDDMVSLDRPVTITYGGKELFRGVVPRTGGVIQRTLAEREDPALTFSAAVTVDLPQ